MARTGGWLLAVLVVASACGGSNADPQGAAREDGASVVPSAAGCGAGGPCADDQVCAGGSCRPACPCAADQTCVDGACFPARCADGTLCTGSDVCVEGHCGDPRCGGQHCGPGVCDPLRAACVQCLADADCAGKTPHCDLASGTCTCDRSGERETACGDGRDNDCDGLVDCEDGDCRGQTCRTAATACDAAEVCTAGACPPDGVARAGTACRPANGSCDLAEACDGVSELCPTDLVKKEGTPCHVAAGPCDAVEVCSGVTKLCPPDALEPAGTVCRPTVPGGLFPACDPAETCSGATADCPLDVTACDAATADGCHATLGCSCGGAAACAPGATCTGGACVGGPGPVTAG